MMLLDVLLVNLRDIYQIPPRGSKGDILFGLPSDGPHTNGFSLINRVDWRNEFLKKNNKICDLTLAEFADNLKTPHKNYYPTVKYFTDVYGNDSIDQECVILRWGINRKSEKSGKSDLNIKYSKEKLAKSYPNWLELLKKYLKHQKTKCIVYLILIGFVMILSPEMKKIY